MKLSLEPEDQRSFQHGIGELLHGMDNLIEEAYSQKQLVKMAQQGKQPPKSWWDNMYNRILKHEKAKARAKKGKYSLKANRHPELIKANARRITGFQWHVNMVLKK